MGLTLINMLLKDFAFRNIKKPGKRAGQEG